MDLTGKTAVITGGAQGLGRGFASAVLENGGNVVIADIEVSKGVELVNSFLTEYGPGRAFFIKCDVTKEEDIENVTSKTKEIYGNLDIFVNNAGINNEDLQTILINLHGVILGTQYALQVMSKEEGGRGGVILNVASTGGLAVVPFSPIYSATKFGVVGFSRCIAARKFETEDQDIRVVCLCPSFTQTSMFPELAKDADHSLLSSVNATGGIMQVPRVVEAFMKLISDPKNNGGVLAVTPKEMEYKFPRRWKAKL